MKKIDDKEEKSKEHMELRALDFDYMTSHKWTNLQVIMHYSFHLVEQLKKPYVQDSEVRDFLDRLGNRVWEVRGEKKRDKEDK